MAMLLMLRGTALVFLSVALIAALDWFMIWLPNDNVGGVNSIWANADEPRTRRKSRGQSRPRTVSFHAAGALNWNYANNWKVENSSVCSFLTLSSQVPSGLAVGFSR